MVLGSCNEKADDDREVEGAGAEKLHLQQNSASVTVAAERSGIVSENGHQRAAVRRQLKPCVANPPHTNRLNRRLLASLWRSKRKRAFQKRHLLSTAFSVRQKTTYTKLIDNTKKLGTAAVVTDITNNSCATVVTDDSKSLMNRIESISADGATVVINAKLVDETVEGSPKKPLDDDDGFRGFDLLPGSSTVIILKTVVTPPRSSKTVVRSEAHGSADVLSDSLLPRNEPMSSTPRNYLEERTDSEKPKVTSRDIAERLKARERKGAPQVSCELCGEVAETYVSLYRHIKKQHDDCTFVRNYLEEIEPLASTPCPVCKKPFMTAASLNTHISSVHPDGRKSKPQPSKLSAQRHHIAAEKRRAQTPASEDSSEDDDEDVGPFACKVCGKQVEDINKYRRHLLTHGEFRFPCEYCDKRFRMKDNLMKHVRRVHGKMTEAPEHRPGPTRPGPAFLQSKTSSVAAKGSGLFRCDQCRMTFNRTSLLVTHMRYCLKQKK